MAASDRYKIVDGKIYRLVPSDPPQEDDYGFYEEVPIEEVLEMILQNKLLYAEIARLPIKQAAEAFGRVNVGLR